MEVKNKSKREVIDASTKAYYTKTHGNRKRFLYIVCTIKDANVLFAPLVRKQVNGEVHLAVDSSFSEYLAKRKTTPQMVKIYGSLKEMESAIEKVGIYL